MEPTRSSNASLPVPRSTWPVSRRFEVTYHEVDALNHLNHAAYFVYMETLRCDYYLELLGQLDPRSLDIIVAEASCRYLAPAFYGTLLLGEVAPAKPLGTTSFSLLYRFSDPERPEKVYAQGRTVIVCFDYATNSKKPIEPGPRARLEKDAIDPEGAGWGSRSQRT